MPVTALLVLHLQPSRPMTAEKRDRDASQFEAKHMLSPTPWCYTLYASVWNEVETGHQTEMDSRSVRVEPG